MDRLPPVVCAAVTTALVAVPALFAIAQPQTSDHAEASVGSLGILTVGAGGTGFMWEAADAPPRPAESGPVPAGEAVIDLDDGGAADLRLEPGGVPATEQPRPVVLTGVTAYSISPDGSLGTPLMGRPAVTVETRGDGFGERRLAGLGRDDSPHPAFDLDHPIDATWTFDLEEMEIPALDGDGGPDAGSPGADGTGGIVFCAGAESGSVSSGGSEPRGAGMGTVLTFLQEGQGDDEDAPQPSPTATVPTDAPDEPLPTITALSPSGEPRPDLTADPPTHPPEDPEPTATADVPTPTPDEDAPEPSPELAETCDEAGAQPNAAPEHSDDGAWSTRFVSSSPHDALVQDPAAGESVYRVEDGRTESAVTGPGLDLSGAERAVHALGLELVAAPGGATATYRNHTTDGVFAGLGNGKQELRTGEDSSSYRWGPTRDAHATWSFTEAGAYCVAYASDDVFDPVRAADGAAEDDVSGAPDDGSAPETRGVEPDGVLTFLVGDVGPSTVDCSDEAAGEEIDLPDPEGDDGSGEGDSDRDGDRDEDRDDDSGVEDRGDPEDAGGIDASEDSDGDGSPGRGDEDDEDEDEDDATRVVAAPATALTCPVDGEAPRQVRSGEFTMGVAPAALDVTADDGGTALPQGSSVVIGDTSRRSAPAGINGFVDAGGEYLATGSATAPGFHWSAADADEAVDLTVEQVDGPGQVRVFMTESGRGLGDGETGAVEPGGSGGMVFGFDQPGEYTVALTVDDDERMALDFAVGDRFASATPGATVLALFSQCPDASLATELAQPASGSATDEGDGGTDAQTQDRSTTALGQAWWAVGGVGMGLALVLLLAILVVVMRETRR
ncbi:hypothetical protein [Brevibacterium jeotgali]|uniref:hypothetical protein n=1 Tax=Brevibacterium jeotgali TaxID=1262550 RepID=UPI000C78E9F3|nr:hypothetical protein [Brevibacterium jeotgali]